MPLPPNVVDLDAVDEVLKLHTPAQGRATKASARYCAECGFPHPCKTRELLTGERSR